MADDITTVDFEDMGEDDDDETTMGDLLKRLEQIKENTEITAQHAQQLMNETPIDKTEQEEAEQKARLTEDALFSNAGSDLSDAVIFPSMDEHTKKIVSAIQELQDTLVAMARENGIPLETNGDHVIETGTVAKRRVRRHQNAQKTENAGNAENAEEIVEENEDEGNEGGMQGRRQKKEWQEDDIEWRKNDRLGIAEWKHKGEDKWRRIKKNEKAELIGEGEWNPEEQDMPAWYEENKIPATEIFMTPEDVEEAKKSEQQKAGEAQAQAILKKRKAKEEEEQAEIKKQNKEKIEEQGKKLKQGQFERRYSFHDNEGTKRMHNAMSGIYNRVGMVRQRVANRVRDRAIANARKSGITDEDMLELVGAQAVEDSGAVSGLGSIMGFLGSAALPLMDIAAVVGLMGASVKFTRDMEQKQVEDSITTGQAAWQNIQDAGYKIGHALGFTQNSDTDIQDYRKSALASDLMLYTKGADTVFEADKWLRNNGYMEGKGANNAEGKYAVQMALMGKSAEQVEEHFAKLSQESKRLGISFQNLSQTTTSEDIYAEETSGSDKGVTKGTEAMLKELKDWGMNPEATFTALSKSNGAAAIATEVLQENGYGALAESTGGSPQMLLEDVSRKGLSDAFLDKLFGMNKEGFMNAFATGSLAQKQAIEVSMEKLYGLNASDWRTGPTTADKILTGQEAVPTAPTNATLTIKLAPGLAHQLALENGDDRASYDMQNSAGYFASHNVWVHLLETGNIF